MTFLPICRCVEKAHDITKVAQAENQYVIQCGLRSLGGGAILQAVLERVFDVIRILIRLSASEPGAMRTITVVILALFGSGRLAAKPPLDEEMSRFKSHPQARAALLAKLSERKEDESVKRQMWSLLKHRGLTEPEIRSVLNHAFNLTTLGSGDEIWWVFDRRTAPEFVYIQPRKWVFLRDGVVIAEKAANTPGNGVEVHPTSSGRGPFAGRFPVGENGELIADEFRLYYEVTYAPSMDWLEGYESFLQVRLYREAAPVQVVMRSHCRQQKQRPSHGRRDSRLRRKHRHSQRRHPEPRPRRLGCFSR